MSLSSSKSSSSSSEGSKENTFPDFTGIRPKLPSLKVKELHKIGKQQQKSFIKFTHEGLLMKLSNEEYLVLELYSEGFQGILYRTKQDLEKGWTEFISSKKIERQISEIMDAAELYKFNYPTYNVVTNNCKHFAEEIFKQF